MDPFSGSNLQASPVILFLIMVWSLLWKGLALWRAAESRQRNWFIAILILNTIGILELVYLFKFAKRKLTINEIKSWINIATTKK